MLACLKNDVRRFLYFSIFDLGFGFSTLKRRSLAVLKLQKPPRPPSAVGASMGTDWSAKPRCRTALVDAKLRCKATGPNL